MLALVLGTGGTDPLRAVARSLVVERARDVELRQISASSRLAALHVDSRRITALPPSLPSSLREVAMLSPDLSGA